MTNSGLIKSWRTTMRLSQREAARVLGCTLTTFQIMERGAMFDTGDPVEPDRRTMLALAAVAAGLAPYGSREPGVEKSRPARRRQAANTGVLSVPE